jgi:hypothetical protein
MSQPKIRDREPSQVGGGTLRLRERQLRRIDSPLPSGSLGGRPRAGIRLAACHATGIRHGLLARKHARRMA